MWLLPVNMLGGRMLGGKAGTIVKGLAGIGINRL